MTALAAMAVLALCALLPLLGHMRSVMRNPTPDELWYSMGLKVAESMHDLIQDENKHASGIFGRMRADGILPDRRKEPRND